MPAVSFGWSGVIWVVATFGGPGEVTGRSFVFELHVSLDRVTRGFTTILGVYVLGCNVERLNDRDDGIGYEAVASFGQVDFVVVSGSVVGIL